MHSQSRVKAIAGLAGSLVLVVVGFPPSQAAAGTLRSTDVSVGQAQTRALPLALGAVTPRDASGRWFRVDGKPTPSRGVPGAGRAHQSLITITDARAREGFVFDVDLPSGVHLAKVGKALVASTHDGTLVGALTAPWAKDAADVEAATRFRVLDRDTFVQVVDHRVVATYPVVADPFWVIPVLVNGGRVLARHVTSAATRRVAMAVARRAIARTTDYNIDDLTARPGAQLNSPFTSGNFRENVRRRTGWSKKSAAPYQAHHTLPQAFDDFWERAGLNHHNPVFGHWWCQPSHSKSARAFNDTWRPFIRKYETRVRNDSTSRNVIERRRIEIVSEYAARYQCRRSSKVQRLMIEEEEEWLGVAPSGRSRF